MKRTFLGRTKQAFWFWHWREQLIAFAITLAAFTVLGPFQSYAMPVGQRALFWALSLMAGWVCVIGMLTLVLRHPAFDEWHGGFRVALAVLIATIPTTFLVSQIETHVGFPDQPAPFWALIWHVLAVCALIGGLVYLRVAARLGLQDIQKPQTPAPFLKRLSYELGGQILSLSMQDHYVEVTTAKGTELILIRLQDAVNEMGAIAGMQIHRSHWVALSGMRQLKRQNGKLLIELVDGRTLPVSRTYAQTVRTILA